MGADNIHRVLIGAKHRREPRQVLNFSDINLPTVKLVAALRQFIRHEILRRLFVAAGRWVGGEVRQKSQLAVKRFVDGGTDAVIQIVLHKECLRMWGWGYRAGSAVHPWPRRLRLR